MASVRGGSRDKPPSIVDVAQHAGVSTATVSRALAAPEQVRPALRERVEMAVRDLGYRPNAAAQRLRGRRSRLILVVTLTRWSAPFFAEVLNGIDSELAANGYAMILGNLDLDRRQDGHLVDMMQSGRFDGVLALAGVANAANGHELKEPGLPLVSICSEIQGTPSILTDEGESIVEAAEHLFGIGHRHFAYLSGPATNFSDRSRWDALKTYFEAKKDECRLDRIEGDFTPRSGAAAAERFLASLERPTAVLSSSDEMAIAFMKVAKHAGVHVPGDVSVCGFDGIDFADYCEPTLTTIRQPRFELGRTGAYRLLQIIAGHSEVDAGRTVLRNTLCLRDSTGRAPRHG
jgi:LacI family repressor for deo operon, udp, cdd, tsx, nupC, and nupG